MLIAMENKWMSATKQVVFFLILISYLGNVDGYAVCKRKTLFGKIRFTCPEPGQSSDLVFCCGDDDDYGGQYCCRSGPFGIDGSSVLNISIGSIIATIAGVIGFVIILLIICCCVCPCCILYKRRTSGTVYRSAAVPSGVGGANVTVVPAPGSVSNPPPVGFIPQGGNNQGYQGYPPQPGYPPQQQVMYTSQPAGYPPYPQQGGLPYPTQPGPPQPGGYYQDQPPPYSGVQDSYQKQPAYNPAY